MKIKNKSISLFHDIHPNTLQNLLP
jgi:hypothetical protein